MVQSTGKLTTQTLEGRTIVVLDTETTGLDPATSHIIEFAAKRYRVENGKLRETAQISFFISHPDVTEIPEFIHTLTGITLADVQSGLAYHTAHGIINDFISGSLVVAHHAPFDLGFLHYQYNAVPRAFLCTRTFARLVHPGESASLGAVAERFGVEQSTAHRAMADVDTTAAVLEKLIEVSADMAPVNILVASPERALTFIPETTQYIVDPNGEPLVQLR